MRNGLHSSPQMILRYDDLLKLKEYLANKNVDKDKSIDEFLREKRMKTDNNNIFNRLVEK